MSGNTLSTSSFDNLVTLLLDLKPFHLVEWMMRIIDIKVLSTWTKMLNLCNSELGLFWLWYISQLKTYAKTVGQCLNLKGNSSGIVLYLPVTFESGPSGCFQLAPLTGSHQGAAATWRQSDNWHRFRQKEQLPFVCLIYYLLHTCTHPTRLILQRLVWRPAEMLMFSSNSPLMGPQQPLSRTMRLFTTSERSQ